MGVAGLKLPDDLVDLGEGVLLLREYAHIVSKPKITFSPKKGKGHVGPWKPIKSWFFGMPAGEQRDIHASVYVPDGAIVGGHDGRELAHWIILLISFRTNSFLAIAYIRGDDDEKQIDITMLGEFLPYGQKDALIEDLDWVRTHWRESIALIDDPSFLFAAEVLLHLHNIRDDGLRMISAWAVLERIFSSKGSELRYRVSANIAAYLEAPGPARRMLFRQTL